MGSTRLPVKVLRLLGNRPVLEWVARAAKAAESIDHVMVATGTDRESTQSGRTALPTTSPCTEAPGRRTRAVADAVQGEDEDTAVVQLTGDCPLLDPRLTSMCVRAFDTSELDYLSTITPRSLR